MNRTVCVVVSGRVQGVGFRAWIARAAAARGVSGWARNRCDGAVEALFSGEATAVGAMIEACRSGPRWAAVDDVTMTEQTADCDVRGFRIIATV